jgi:peptidoglycan/xylan/chitin deacetylase (PgdA/CDA1 family)
MRKKALLSSLICQPWIYSIAKKISNKRLLRVLAYHRILDINESSYPFDEEIISASTNAFDEQMKFVSQNYNIITFHELTDLVKNRHLVPERSLIISFDDGYADNSCKAVPILKKYGLKAVFFITTDYIGSFRPFWFELLIYLGKKRLLDIRDLYFSPSFPFVSSNNDQVQLVRDLRLYLMKIPNHERLRILQEIEDKVQIEMPENELKLVRALTWDEIREMAKSGMEIGSHTKSHLILRNARKDELVEELRVSKHIIEEKIGQPVNSISYPVGKHFAVSPFVIREVEAEGYHWGTVNISGVERIPIKDQFLVKRLKVERYMDIDWFKSQLLFPGILS